MHDPFVVPAVIFLQTDTHVNGLERSQLRGENSRLGQEEKLTNPVTAT